MFPCSSNPSDYTNGVDTDTYPNTATLTGDNTDLSDDAEVTVTCTLAALKPSKTAAGTYDRTVTWELEKTVAPASHSGNAGETAGASMWTVKATRNETLGNYQVSGSITINNPATIDQTFTIGDVLNDGTIATVNCSSFTVPAATGGIDGSITYTYTASPGDSSVALNTTGDDTTTLADPRFSFSQNISSDTTKKFSDSFSCPASSSSLYVRDQYSFMVTNKATLTAPNTNLSDTATVTVNCERPQQTSIAITAVRITSATKGTNGTVNGSFTIQNQSGGSITVVTLGTVSQSFTAKGGGSEWKNLTGTCAVTPSATGAVAAT